MKFVGEVAKMPQSLKQLNQRYEVVCANIKNAKQFATEKLHPKIELDVVAFLNSFGEANLDEVEAGIDEMEEVISQERKIVLWNHTLA